MQTKSPLMDELAKITTAAMGLAQAASEEAKTAFRAQGDKLVVEFDLVRRDELDALKAEITALRAEVAALKPGARPAPAAKADSPKKTASTKPRAKPKG
jgi:BMFP domain-containing protein YqiC